jgi:hypothetical protein
VKNSVIACVASGPSLTSDDCRRINDAGIPLIAVNNSWRAAPFCAVVYAADCCWWEEYGSDINIPAARWCGDAFTARRFGINHLKTVIPGSFNSGQRAIELAAHLGASTVLLVGYDCSIRGGVHWHGRHAVLDNPDVFSVSRWHDEFDRLRSYLPGVDIINCSHRTRLEAFRRLPLEDALNYVKTNSLHPRDVRAR